MLLSHLDDWIEFSITSGFFYLWWKWSYLSRGFKAHGLQERAPRQHHTSIFINAQTKWDVGISDGDREVLITSNMKKATFVTV